MDFACSFFVEGKPIPKGNHRAFIRGSKAIVTDTQGGNLSDWEAAIRNAARSVFQYGVVTDRSVILELTFHFLHPKNHFTPKGKETSRFRMYHIVKPDADKLTRAVGDALTGVVYRDDSQVMYNKIKKVYDCKQGVMISIYIGE